MMSEKTKKTEAFLEIEENEGVSKQKIVNLLSGLNENIKSEGSTKKKELKTFPLMPPENLLSRVANFLPQIASDNKELTKKDVKSIDIENVEGEERIIEMDLGLGIFEQIKKPAERDIIVNLKDSSFDSLTKPKIIMTDNETRDGKRELSIPHIIFKDDFDDEDSESFNILMNAKSLNGKRPNIIVLDDNQISDDKGNFKSSETLNDNDNL